MEHKQLDKPMILMFILVLLVSVDFIFLKGNIEYLNSDSIASITYLTAVRETGSVFPEGWYGGTQIQLNSYLLLPIACFVDNLLVAKNVVQLIMFFALIVFIVFLNRFMFNDYSGLLTVVLCFSGFFVQFTRLYTVYCEYNYAVVVSIVYIFFFLKSFGDSLQIISKRSLVILLLTLFIFCSFGAQAIQMIVIPTICYLLLRIISKSRNRTIVKNSGVIALIVLCTSSLGLLVYSTVISKVTGVVGLSNVYMIKSTADLANIKSLAVQSIEKWIGVDRIYVNNYIELLYIILRVAASVLMIGIGPIAWFIRAKKKGKLNNKSIFFIIFLGVNLTEIVLIFMFSKAYTAGHHVRYFTNSFLFLCCVSSAWLYEIIHSIKRVYLSYLLVFISVLTASLQLVSPYDDYLRQFETKTELVRYLEDNNLNYGYSSYWYSGVNSAISNESVRINSLILNGREIEPFLFLNYKGWYTPQRYEGSTFLILDESEFSNDYWREFAFNICGEPSKVIMFQDLYILTYDYNISSVFCYS